MKIAKIITMALAASFFVTGCNSSELGPHRDVAWFMEHEDEMREVIKKCENDAKFAAEPNCENAADANFKLQMMRPERVPNPPPGWKGKY